MQTLYEELLKAGQFLDNEPAKNAERVSNFYVLCASIREGYKGDQVQWRINFRPASVGTIDHREGADLCALLEYGIETNTPVGFSADFFDDKIVGGLPAVQGCGQNSSMLIDVAEIVNHGECVPIGVYPCVIGLQIINLCKSLRGHSVKAMSGNLRLKCVLGRTDREHVLVIGSVLSGQDKFPHQIVEGRPEILEKVADDKWNPFGNRATSDNFPDELIRGTFLLSDHFGGIRLEIPLRLNIEFVEVLLSPVELALNRIGKRHPARVAEYAV